MLPERHRGGGKRWPRGAHRSPESTRAGSSRMIAVLGPIGSFFSRKCERQPVSLDSSAHEGSEVRDPPHQGARAVRRPHVPYAREAGAPRGHGQGPSGGLRAIVPRIIAAPRRVFAGARRSLGRLGGSSTAICRHFPAVCLGTPPPRPSCGSTRVRLTSWVATRSSAYPKKSHDGLKDS
jgi:hypothetical protein